MFAYKTFSLVINQEKLAPDLFIIRTIRILGKLKRGKSDKKEYQILTITKIMGI